MNKIIDPSPKPQGIQSIEIAFTILECFKEQALTLTELSKQMDMSKSRVHKYLISFTRLGVLVQNKKDSTYSMGPRLIELGQYALRQYDIISIAEPILRELSNQLNQSIYITVWSDQGPVVVKHFESKNPVNIMVREGIPYPLLMSAAGKCFAAFMSATEVQSLIQQEIIQYQLNEEKIEEELNKIRQEQLSIRKTQFSGVPGSKAMATPIFDYNNNLVAAICMIGFTGEFEHDLNSKHVAMLKKAAKDISE